MRNAAHAPVPDIEPPFGDWREVVRANHATSRGWVFTVSGSPGRELREHARREALQHAERFSERLGVSVGAVRGPDAPIVVTGHQPELYHPGVWIKTFLLQRLAEDVSGTGIDVVVDTDGFNTLGVAAPCLSPEARRCHQYLAVGSSQRCFACTPSPSSADIDRFCSSARSMVDALGEAEVSENFARFCQSLRLAGRGAENLAELVTFARRDYESSAGSGYLELPVTSMVRSRSWTLFVADIARRASRFAEAHNTALREFRAATGTRSRVQPFADLEVGGEGIELPFWAVRAGRRFPVHARGSEGGVALVTEGEAVAVLAPDADPEAAIQTAGAIIAPKAITLTMYVRMFVADLFIHGTGGARYDRVTDAVCRAFYGVEPPSHVTATLTMHLPLAVSSTAESDAAAVRERLNRLAHNPDALLGDAGLSGEDLRRAQALAEEKSSLVSAISRADADKKALGLRIREVNTEMASLLSPLRARLADELVQLEAERAGAEVLMDRTYPFCFFSPGRLAEIARAL